MIRLEKKSKSPRKIVDELSFMTKKGRPLGGRQKETIQMSKSVVEHFKAHHGEDWRNAVDATLVNHVNAVTREKQ